MTKSKKKRKVISPIDKELQKAERQFQSKKSVAHGLILVRNKTKPSYMPYVVRGLNEQSIISEQINPDPFPKNYNYIKGSRPWAPKDLKRDALWIASTLSIYQNEINEFVKLKAEYEQHILRSDFSAAEVVLNKVDSLFGKSLWLIENKLLLVDKKDGVEKQRLFTREITDDTNNNYFVKILTYFFSMRVEPNHSVSRLNDLVNDVCVDTGIPELEKAYIKFHLFPFDHIESSDIGGVLNRDMNSPIIDKYLSLCKFIKLVFSWPEYQNLQRDLYLAIQEMSRWAPDKTVMNLAALLNSKEQGVALHSEATQVLEAFDFYTEGQYENALNAFDTILNAHPSYVELYEARVKAANHAGEAAKEAEDATSLKDELFSLMHQVLLKSPSFDVAINKLLKYTLSHASHAWSSHILSFLRRDGRKRWQEDMHAYTIQSALSSRVFNAWQSRVFEQFNKGINLSGLLEKALPESTTLLLERLNSLPWEEFERKINELSLPEERKRKYACFKLIVEGEYEKAIEVMAPIVSSEERGVNYYDALRYTMDCYRLAGRVKECSDLTVNAYLENNFVFSFLAIPELMNLIQEEFLPDAAADITWPILNEIFYRHYSNSIEDARLDAYQDFLEENDLDVPSQISIDNIQRPFLVFFLRYVCTLNVLENSVAFNSSEEMFQERMKIYQILGRLDPDNAQEYISETAALAEQISVRKLSRQIEQSKVYVDVDGIKSKLEKDSSDKYDRFIDLANNPKLDIWSEGFVKTLLDQIQKPNDEMRIVLPRREADYIFANLVADITEKFVTSTDFGLDFYISTRIRHGTLSGQLRSPLEGLSLLTTKDIKGNTYKDNDYWADKLHRLESSKQKELQKLLKDFSRSFDKLIDDLKENWFQVKLTEKQSGFFDYSNRAALIKQVYSKINTKRTTYDEFLDLVFEGLWDITEQNLSNIRKKLKTEFEPNVIGLLNKLKDDSRSSMGDYFYDQGFSSTITTAITDFQTSVDRVVEWCRISRSIDTPDTPVRRALTVGIEGINSYDPRYPLDPEISITSEPELVIKGECLSYFTDIFLILFHNVKIHSEIDDRSPAMKIDISQEKGVVKMLFSNELGDGVESGEIERKLKKALEDTPLTEIVQREGGSGLLKLKKILKMDLKCAPKTTAYIKDGWLYIEINIQGKNILK